MVNNLQQSVHVPQRLDSVTGGVISIHSPRETIRLISLQPNPFLVQRVSSGFGMHAEMSRDGARPTCAKSLSVLQRV